MDASINPARPHLTATAHGTGSTPSTVTVTIGDVTHVVDVTPDRDDWQWQLGADDSQDLDILWAIDDAVEAYLADADDACEPRRIERVWARAVAS